jgi:hypothetical protein
LRASIHVVSSRPRDDPLAMADDDRKKLTSSCLKGK